jgi:hypothetical protein
MSRLSRTLAVILLAALAATATADDSPPAVRLSVLYPPDQSDSEPFLSFLYVEVPESELEVVGRSYLSMDIRVAGVETTGIGRRFRGFGRTYPFQFEVLRFGEPVSYQTFNQDTEFSLVVTIGSDVSDDNPDGTIVYRQEFQEIRLSELPQRTLHRGWASREQAVWYDPYSYLSYIGDNVVSLELGPFAVGEGTRHTLVITAIKDGREIEDAPHELAFEATEDENGIVSTMVSDQLLDWLYATADLVRVMVPVGRNQITSYLERSD